LPPSRFYAIGEVIEPRERERYRNQPLHVDSIGRVTQHGHRFLDGVVRYTPDTSVFYEDYTDPWVLRDINPYSQQPEDWRYPQRIDVKKWVYIRSGIPVDGLAEAAPLPLYRYAVFEIPKSFFDTIRAHLQG
jgi:hypothetical protein